MTEEEKKAIDLLKFYEGFFKNIGHEEEVKSIESVINCIEKLQKENEELNNRDTSRLSEIGRLRTKNNHLENEIKYYYIPKDKIREIINEELPDDEICKACERYDVNGVVIKQNLIKVLEEE